VDITTDGWSSLLLHRRLVVSAFAVGAPRKRTARHTERRVSHRLGPTALGRPGDRLALRTRPRRVTGECSKRW
jgi:hypothetical protein